MTDDACLVECCLLRPITQRPALVRIRYLLRGKHLATNNHRAARATGLRTQPTSIWYANQFIMYTLGQRQKIDKQHLCADYRSCLMTTPTSERWSHRSNITDINRSIACREAALCRTVHADGKEGSVGGVRRPSITAYYADRSCLWDSNINSDRCASDNANWVPGTMLAVRSSLINVNHLVFYRPRMRRGNILSSRVCLCVCLFCSGSNFWMP